MYLYKGKAMLNGLHKRISNLKNRLETHRAETTKAAKAAQSIQAIVQAETHALTMNDAAQTSTAPSVILTNPTPSSTIAAICSTWSRNLSRRESPLGGCVR